jgi:hypothetical protein
MSLPAWRDQEAANETIFREMNEWTEEVADARRLGTGGHPMETYLCECSDRTCAEPIGLTRREYEPIRSVSVLSAIAGTWRSSGRPVPLRSSLSSQDSSRGRAG